MRVLLAAGFYWLGARLASPTRLSLSLLIGRTGSFQGFFRWALKRLNRVPFKKYSSQRPPSVSNQCPSLGPSGSPLLHTYRTDLIPQAAGVVKWSHAERAVWSKH